MYCILSILGEQFVVNKLGEEIKVPKINQDKKDNVKILLAKEDNGNFKIGKPFIEGDVEYVVIERSAKGKKVNNFIKGKRFKKNKGQRQLYTKISIKSIKI